jgi:hypothetical protein
MGEAQRRMSDLFDRARDAMRVEDLAGKLVKLRGAGDSLRGTCPLCQASPSSGSVFKVDVARQTWRCFACEQHGDVVDLYAAVERMTLADAARRLAGPDPVQVRPIEVQVERPIGDDDRAKRIARMAADMFAGSRPIQGTPGAAYLLGRGIISPIVERLDGPRFNPDTPHSWNPDARVWRRSAAIVCRIVTPGGWTGGVHVTYIGDDGARSTLSPRKLMWGPQVEETAAGKRRGGSWLIGSFPDDGDAVIGEGIETSLSLASLLWKKGARDFGVCAALSLGSLQGVVRRDGEGCVDISAPTGDPAAPPFTWPPCYTAGKAPPTIRIAIDRDMSPVKIKTKTPRGLLVDTELDAEDRAKLAAILAKAAWTAAGWKATAMLPPPGKDWNDVLTRSRK